MFHLHSNNRKSLDLTSFFSADDIVVADDDCDRDRSIYLLLNRLAAVHGISDAISYQQAILERESFADTVVPQEIALPHTRIDNLQRPYVGVLTSEKGISFSDEMEPVHLVFLILIPTSQPALYLQILKAIASLFEDTETVHTVSRMKDPDEIMRFFEKGGLVLPDFLLAADIMSDQIEPLRITESLKTAIDRLILRQQIELPIVNEDGEMLDVIRAKSLLEKNLPKHFLWFRNLSKRINFESFSRLLHGEESLCLADVMTKRFASVQMSSPALHVALELAKRDTAYCYVLNGKRYAGTIDLPYFLKKIFRE